LQLNTASEQNKLRASDDKTKLASMTEADTKPAAPGSPFWRFSLKLYRAPGVADACIALQEGAGVDVNLLLFLLWQATQRRVFMAADVAALEQRIGGWRETTVIPLRNLRRALKSPPGLVAAGTAEAFRTRIKAVELEAERLQQEAMYELAATSPLGRAVTSPAEAARLNVAAYASMRAVAFPSAAVDTILAALAKLEGE
jgi:uncharacterized protein (TIGR02444 family)